MSVKHEFYVNVSVASLKLHEIYIILDCIYKRFLDEINKERMEHEGWGDECRGYKCMLMYKHI